jgi:hypothetical protein
VAKWGEDTPGSRSVQLKAGMMVHSINGESTVGCGAQKLVTIMKKKVSAFVASTLHFCPPYSSPTHTHTHTYTHTHTHTHTHIHTTHHTHTHTQTRTRTRTYATQGLLGQSKKTVTATFEVTNSLVPEVAGGDIEAEVDTLRAQKVAWWSRTGPRSKKKSGEGGNPPQTPMGSSMVTRDSAVEQTPDAGPQFVLTRPLRPVSQRRERRGSGGTTVPDDARANLPALRVDDDSTQDAPVNAQGKRVRNRMSIRQRVVDKEPLAPRSSSTKSSSSAYVGAPARQGLGGGNSSNPLFGQKIQETSFAGSSSSESKGTDDDDDDDDDDAAMAEPGTLSRARPTIAPPPPHRATLPASDYFLSMINNGVAEGEELQDADGCRYHFASGRPVYREEDVEALREDMRPETPTGINSFRGKKNVPDKRHVVDDDDADTNFGFDSGDVDDLDDIEDE